MNKWECAHMKAAEIYSQLSTAKNLKVGCVIVKDNRIISIGYNGMPSGWENDCEYEEELLVSVFDVGTHLEKTGKLKTKPEVLHAEANAITKVAKSNESCEGSTLYTTASPCMECAKLIYQSGVERVWFKDEYRDTSGIDFLIKCNVEVLKYDSEISNLTV